MDTDIDSYAERLLTYFEARPDDVSTREEGGELHSNIWVFDAGAMIGLKQMSSMSGLSWVKIFYEDHEARVSDDFAPRVQALYDSARERGLEGGVAAYLGDENG